MIKIFTFVGSNMRKNKLWVILFIVLLESINVCSASIGIQPNMYGDTVINQDTIWDESDTYCGGNVSVGNSSQKINLLIKDSHITVRGKWTMGGDTPVNFTLLNSTILFDVENGILTSQPSGGVLNTSQKILVEGTYDETKPSNITIRNSTIRGKDSSHLAAGLDINSGGISMAKHSITIDNVIFEYMGALDTTGHSQYAFKTGYEIDPFSKITNITINYCGRGIFSNGNAQIINVTSKGGYLAFIGGKNWSRLSMNKTIEGLYNPSDGAWIGDSYFDSGETKLNIMSSSNVIFDNNTVVLAALNAGDGSWDHKGNNNTLLNNEFINSGVGSRKDRTKILNNTFYEGMPSAGNIPINVAGYNFSVKDNEITRGITAILVIPYYTYDSAGGHIIQNNTINASGTGISIRREYDNEFINNTIKNTCTGAGIQVEKSRNQVFRDNSISNSKTYDIYLKGGNDNISFINTNFDENKIGFDETLDVFKSYYYLDVKTVDSSGDPVSEATVNIINEIDNTNCKSVNVYAEEKTSFITKADGHTPLPSDKKNSIVLLDFWQNKTQKMNMTYTITVEKEGYSTTVTDINPNSSWYRPDPNIPTYTKTIVLPLNVDENPVASAGPNNTVYINDELTFNGSASTDDKGIVSYAWDFDVSDGLQQEAIGAVAQHTYESSGTYTVTLTVTDIDGNTDSDTCLVTVLDKPSNTIVFISPTSDNIIPGEPFTIDVFIEPGTNITGAQFDLQFNSSMLRADNVTEGNLLNQDGAGTFFNSGTINNSTGTVTKVYGSILTSNVSSPGVMATISMTAGSSTGITELNLSNVIVSDTNPNATQITINNATVLIDTAPVLNLIGSKSVSETNTLTFMVDANDADGDDLTYSSENLPDGANFDPAARVFTWTPASGQAGDYTVTFGVSDGYLSDSEDVSINVSLANNIPVIDSFKPENGSIFNEKDKIDISVNASDADGDELYYTIRIDGVNCSTEQSYIWKTDFSSSGLHTIEVTVGDERGAQVIEQHTIYVNEYHPGYDVNKDWEVNILDIASVAQNFGTTTTEPYPRWDVTQDGDVNIQDLSLVGHYFGEKIE